ncbi:MAG: hypothetical protein KGZ74_05830 [Chitinophagaceae bacterium]|nr:hypothetical protein [Chitinophagaceae bacterium]
MGRYMNIILKPIYRNESFLKSLNDHLSLHYGSNTGIKFNTWESLQEEVDYFNKHPFGVTQVPHIKRPMTKEFIEQQFFWNRYVTYSFKLSGGDSSADEARDAVAVCKWIINSRKKYIDTKYSVNYQPSIVKNYLDHYFLQAGYDMNKLWSLPIL